MTADVAELGLVVDTRQVLGATKALGDFVRASEKVDQVVVRGQVALERLAAAQARTAKATNDAAAASSRKAKADSDAAAAGDRAAIAALKLAQAQERATRAANQGETAFQRMLRQATAVQSAMGSAGQSLAQFSGLLGPLAGLVAGGFSAAAIVGFVKAVADAGSAVQLMVARIGLLTGPGGAVATFNALFNAAQRTGTSLQSTVDTFARIGFAAKDMGATTNQVVRLTETVQKLGRVGGATGSELSAGMLQLGQALASGRLNGDELRSILENLPLVARAIAENLGVGVGQLRAMGAAGELTSQKVFDALLAASAKADEQFAKLPVTMEQAAQKAANAWTYFANALNDATGFSNALAKALDVVADAAVRAAKRISGDIDQAMADALATLTRLEAARDRASGPSASGAARENLPRLNVQIAEQKALLEIMAKERQEAALLAAHFAGLDAVMGKSSASAKDINDGLNLMFDKLNLVRAGIDPVTGAVRFLTKEQLILETVSKAVAAAIEQGGEAMAVFGGDAAAALAMLKKLRAELDPETKKQIENDKRLAEQIKKDLMPATEQYAKDVADLIRLRKANLISVAEEVRGIENLNNWLYQNATAYAAVRHEQEKSAKAAVDLETELENAHKDDTEGDLKKRAELLRQLQTPMDKYVDAVRELNSMQAKGLVVGDDYSRTLENINQWLQEQDPAFAKAKQAAEDYARELERVVGRTADRLVDFGADNLFDAMTGKSKNFWEEFEELGKRAIAQIAAEALIRPLVVPVIQSVVSGAPGLFGVQGQQGSGFNPLGMFQTAGQVKDGVSFMQNPLGSLSNLFSPDNFIANAFPSLFGSGISAGGALASTLTGPGGMMLGGGVQSAAMMGAGPLAGLAPFLPVLAIALPLLMSFFMGGKKSVGPNANAIINFERDANGRLTNPGGLAIGGLGADNGGDKNYAREMAKAATEGFNQIIDRLGASVTSVPGAGLSNQLELGYFAEGEKYFSIVGGDKQEFGSADEAVADFVKRTLQQAEISGISDDVRLALSNTVASSMEDLGKDIDFAANFRRSVDLAAAGPGTRQAQELQFRYAAQDNAIQQRLAMRDYLADAKRLFGEDSQQYADARSTTRNQALAMIGLGPDTDGANKPLEGMAAEVVRITEQFSALKQVLIDTGLSADEAQTKIDEGIKKTFQKIATDQEKAVTEAILAAEGPGAAAARGLMEGQKKRRNDYLAAHTAAGETTIDTSNLDKLDRLEAGQALIGMTTAQLNAVAAEMERIGDASPGMESALQQAYKFATLAEGAGKLQMDLAKWSYEDATLTQAAADAKQDYISALQSEIQVQQQLADGFTRLAEKMKETRLGLLIDSNLSPLSPVDRLAEARRQFNDIATKAQAGDMAAGENLPEIARSFLEASKAYNAGTVDYFNDFQTVQTVLRNTETVAERQARTANEQLVVLRQQLAEVQGQSDDIQTIAEAAEAWRTANQNVAGRNDNRPAEQKAAFDTLATNFQNAYAGAASDNERSQVYAAAASQRDALLGAITDIATLQAIGQQYYAGNSTDSGAIFLRSRLYSLGVVPAFEFGGDHMGGLRLVGERGPEIEATGPARYWSSEQAVAMLSRAGSASNDNSAMLAGVTALSLHMLQHIAVSREGFQQVIARLDRLIEIGEASEANDRLMAERDAA